jgi:nucleotide-binding universal stress UspA family protein
MRTIVVGIDGSKQSTNALRWALEEADCRGNEVLAITAWSVPASATPMLGVTPAFYDTDFEVEAETLLKETVEKVTADVGLDVPVRTKAVSGSAARALVDASRDAELLVVGSRGYGGFRGLLLGSVGQQCAQHSFCPVVIVRGADTVASLGSEASA